MTYPILTTKLFIPPLRADRLGRPHLIEKLNKGATYPLTLVSASAGFGKTTLLSEWTTQHSHPTAWYSLDQGDNDPAIFLTYFISALRTIWEQFGVEILNILQSSQIQDFTPLMINLINEITRSPEPFSLILDDYHLITNLKVHELVAYLFDNLPLQMRLVIASRMDPPLPITRYRVRNQLLEIRDRDLRFSLAEAAEFLQQRMGMNLTVEQVKALEERTEGWIAGLQLAALSMRDQANPSGFVKAFTGSHLFVAEYLVEEILKQQPDDIQAFLLKTSILERLQGNLCETVSGCTDGQAILQSLQHANVFVIPLDNTGTWYRYHHLFADLLRSRLPRVFSAEALKDLHQRASRWYEHNGFLQDAVVHASEVNDFERISGLVLSSAHSLLFSGQVNLLEDWLDLLPQTTFEAHPELAFYLFWVEVLKATADLSDQSLQEKEALLRKLPSSPENDRLRGELMSVICRAITLSGRTTTGIRLADEALEYLPADDLASRARANSALAIAHDLEGRSGVAGPIYQESLTQAITAGDFRLAAHTLMVKGLIQCHYGLLHEAIQTFQDLINLGNRPMRGSSDRSYLADGENITSERVFYPAGQGYIGMAIVYLEWYDLQTAKDYLEKGMDLCRRGGLDGLFIAKMQISRLLQAEGDLEGAVAELQMPEQVGRVDNFRIPIRQIQLALARGGFDEAWHWATPFTAMLNDPSASTRMPLIFYEQLEAIIARVYLAHKKFEQAQQLLYRLEVTARSGQRLARLIEVYLVRALIFLAQNGGHPTPQSVEYLCQALSLAEPQDYALLFVEEGQPLVVLLEAVQNQPDLPENTKKYASNLLSMFAEISIPTPSQVRSVTEELVEQLTPREMEVLILIAAGDSNQAIAEKLVITVRTVKKHTSNIYGKLNVDSRTQAVAYARQTGLLPAEL